MNELLKVVLSLSLSGTLLFFIILALKPLYKNKLNRSWQYYIWLIVIGRMLLPFTPEITLVGTTFEYLGYTSVEIIPPISPTTNVQSHIGLGENYTTSNIELQVPKSTTSTTMPLSFNTIILKVFENLWILWAAIAFALLVRKITMYQSFVRFVKAGRTEVADIEMLNMLADVGETIGVKRPVELFINPLISSPMLLGFFRPYIILPSIELEKTELAYIMRHELTHYKHMDMFYKWLVQITVCLHWFNPFAYRLAKEINKCCELCCDEAIIRTMDKDEKKAYGDTLLNSLKGMGNYNDKHATVTLTEGAEQLKERLDAIMKFKKASKITVTIMLSLTLVLAVGATAIGAYAATPTPTQIRNISNANVEDVESPTNLWAANVGKSDLNKLAEDYYTNNKLTSFLAIFSSLNINVQKEYCSKMIQNGQTAFLSSCAKNMNQEMLNYCTEKTYEQDKIALFSCIAPYLSDNQKQTWTARVSRDGKNTFLSVLTGKPHYTYSQRGYYQGDYIFELGWNLNTESNKAYSDKVLFTLSDGSTITVSFDKSCKNESQDNAVLLDLKKLVEKLKKQYANSTLLVEKPLVVSVKYVGNSDLVKLAETFYINGELTSFSAIFSSLDVTVQKEYCTKMIDNGKAAFLSVSAENMNTNLLDYCAEKSYEKNNIALFSCIAPHLTNTQKQLWVARASTDSKNTFVSVLTDNQVYPVKNTAKSVEMETLDFKGKTYYWIGYN